MSRLGLHGLCLAQMFSCTDALYNCNINPGHISIVFFVCSVMSNHSSLGVQSVQSVRLYSHVYTVDTV